MAALNFDQRCRNHETREAACRCPSCGHSYCRECVTEHEGRLLCSACLIAKPRGERPRHAALRQIAAPAMLLFGLLLGWLVYWAAGESVIALIRRMEQEPRSGLVNTSIPGTTLFDV